MSAVCGTPDPLSGVVVRIASYLDCQGRSLGENGFQALAGGPVGTGLLSGLTTIFIALIGYRLILGHAPTMRDGVGWSVRLGVVLALVTSWPAFQAVAYRVVVDGPSEISAVVLPAAGLPSAELDARVQQAYDTIRLGVMNGGIQSTQSSGQSLAEQAGQPDNQTQQIHFQTPLPNTASLLVISTVGLVGIFKVMVGFLLAIAPLALMGVLFENTIGFFNGWLRALAGSALAVLGITVVTAVDLVLVESELARLQAFRIGAVSMEMDPQALTTIVGLFFIASILVILVAMRLGGAIKLKLASPVMGNVMEIHSTDAWPRKAWATTAGAEIARLHEATSPSRAAMVREALVKSVSREKSSAFSESIGHVSATASGSPKSREARRGRAESATGRRGIGMSGRASRRRDKRL